MAGEGRFLSIKSSGFFAGFVRNRGKFVIRNCRPICDDPLTLRRYGSWRCNFGRTASIATRICRRIQRRRAFAATNAPSALTVPRTSSPMCVRIAGADLRAANPPRNGMAARCVGREASAIGQARASQICPRRGCSALASDQGYSAGAAVEHSLPSLRANGSRECAPDDRLREAIQKSNNDMDCFVAFAPRNDRMI